METCGGTHHFYVADTGTVELEGKVIVILVCTACGEGKFHEFKVVGIPQLQSNKGKINNDGK